jgi:DNA invertase Pin-like site-specific DNA recombinase
MIAERTRAALAQKKAQGALLGNRTNLGEAQAKGVAANRAVAAAFAANVLPIVRQIEAAGAKTHRAIAAALNARGIRTARGGPGMTALCGTPWRARETSCQRH